MKHLVFDLGRVLIDWTPEAAFAHHFAGTEPTLAWMRQVGFAALNARLDAGADPAAELAAAEAAHGDAAAPLRDYVARFPLTIDRPIPGTWEIAETLRARGHRLFAITNWGRETWPAAIARYPQLETLFEDIVISGIVRLAKPDPAIFRLLLDRNGLAAGDCLFIDDNPGNVAAAASLGMDGIVFADAPALARELGRRGIG